jgi:hypothetical protein
VAHTKRLENHTPADLTMPFKLSPRQVADNCRLPVHAIVSKGCHGRTDADSLSEGARYMLLYSKKGEIGDGRQQKKTPPWPHGACPQLHKHPYPSATPSARRLARPRKREDRMCLSYNTPRLAPRSAPGPLPTTSKSPTPRRDTALFFVARSSPYRLYAISTFFGRWLHTHQPHRPPRDTPSLFPLSLAFTSSTCFVLV